MKRNLGTSELAVLGAILIWGINVPLLKLALAEVPPFTSNAIRFTFSIFAVGFVYFKQGRPAEITSLTRKDWLHLFLLGLLNHLVYQTLFIFGIFQTSAGNTALLLASAPLWTAIIGQLFGIDYLKLVGWLGLSLTLIGTVFVIVIGPKEFSFSDETLVGNLLVLASAACWGSYTVLSKPVLTRLNAVDVTFFGLIFMLPFLWMLTWLEPTSTNWLSLSITTWGILFFSGALSVGLAFVLWNIAVKGLGPAQTAAFGNLVPVIALTASYLILSEEIYWLQAAGGGLILAGLFVMRRAR